MTTSQGERKSVGWTADDSTFGARLALIRQRMGWGNVKEAAVECGLPPESWRTWERDNVAPRRIVEVAAAIADKTGCDFMWLLAGPRTSQGRDNVPNGADVVSVGQSHPSGGSPRRATRGPDRPMSAVHRPRGRNEGASTGPGLTRPAIMPRRTSV